MSVSPQIHTFKTIRHLLPLLLILRISLQRCIALQGDNKQCGQLTLLHSNLCDSGPYWNNMWLQKTICPIF